jgi:uncharacterized protein
MTVARALRRAAAQRPRNGHTARSKPTHEGGTPARGGKVTRKPLVAVLACLVAGGSLGSARAATTVDQRIRMSDGVDLVADVHVPDGGARFPVIVMISPYGRLTPSTEYLDDGYAHVNVDVRGTGRSGGVNCLMCDREQQDVYEVVEWAAAQPWSTGRIGMMGGSYLAFLQLLGAAKQPPSLRAIVPRVAYDDLYRDDYWQNGMFNHIVAASFSGFQPAASITGGTLEPALLPVQLNRSSNPVWMTEVRQRPFDGDFYGERSVYPKYDAIDIPALFVGGWFDIFIGGTIENFNGIASNSKRLIIGPWTHHRAGGFGETSPEPYPDVHLPGPDPILEWFDHHLKGIDNGADDAPRVQYYDLGTDTWQTADTWPPAGAELTDLYLSGAPSGSLPALHDGSLVPDPPADGIGAGAETYTYDPSSGLAQATSADGATFLAPFRRNDQRVDEIRGVTYTTPPLGQPVSLAGPIELELWASTTARDADWVVKVSHVQPDGTSLWLSAGYVRATHRAVDQARSRPGQPWLRNTAADAVPHTEPVLYRIPIDPLGVTLAPGDRLRIAVYSADPLVHEPLTEPAVNSILHDGDHPSRLRLTMSGRCWPRAASHEPLRSDGRCGPPRPCPAARAHDTSCRGPRS